MNQLQQARLVNYLEAMIKMAIEGHCSCTKPKHDQRCVAMKHTRAARTYVARLRRKGVIR